jgi:tetratricopeptide (TPR) repeat protein
MTDANSLVAEAFTHHNAGNFPQAEKLYRQALEREPANLNALHMLGVLTLSTERTEEAVALLRHAVATLANGDSEGPQHATLYHNLGNALLARQQVDEAIASYRRAVLLDPAQTESWSRLGHAELARLRLGEAVTAFRSAMRADPHSPVIRFQLAQALHLAGDYGDAAELIRQLCKDHPGELAFGRELARIEFAHGDLNAALKACHAALSQQTGDADILCLVGRIHHQQLDFAQAENFYRAALQARPDDIDTLPFLAILQQDMEQPNGALEICRRLLRQQPDNANALCILGWAQRKLKQHAAAIDSFRHCLRIKPDFPQAETQLGQVLKLLNRRDEAVACFEHVISLHPDYADAHISFANLIQDRDPARAQASFRHAHAIRPLTTLPAVKQPADFAALFVTAPGVANTPTEYLAGKNDYDAHFLCLLPGIDYDLDLLRRHADVVVNLVSDADQGHEMLPLARDLVDRLQRPVVNHPDKIEPTDRATIARRLSAIPGCRVPKIIHLSHDELENDLHRLDDFDLPLLLRVAGKHGGDDFEMINDRSEIPDFLTRLPAEDYYAIQYIDYRSPDGFFRKYRMILTGQAILPYHLAIHDGWKVHHYTTEMGQHPWMQAEEAVFLAKPDSVFSPAHYESMRAIQAEIGLDYFGIDCSLDQDGNLLIFEVNASMLVHDRNEEFPYKDPYVALIKQAFDAMLLATARSVRADG